MKDCGTLSKRGRKKTYNRETKMGSLTTGLCLREDMKGVVRGRVIYRGSRTVRGFDGETSVGTEKKEG